MRLTILKFAYPDYLRAWYWARPDEGARSYTEQATALDHDAFWWNGAWAGPLAQQGIEVSEIIANAQPLQRAWARERGLQLSRGRWMAEALRAQIAEAQPELLFIQSFRGLSAPLLGAIRAETASLRAVIGWVGSPLHNERLLGMCNLVLSCVPEVVYRLRADGHACEHLNHAFDPRVLDRIGAEADDEIGFSFAGNLSDALQHGPRAAVLREVARVTPLHVFARLPRSTTSRRGVLAGTALYAFGRGLRQAGVAQTTLQAVPLLATSAKRPARPRLVPPPAPPARMHAPIYGLRMFKTLRDSRVTLNAHSTISPQSASNLRMFEATGSGACLLTDARENVSDLFEPDREVVTYRSAVDCIERATWLLDHPTEATRIAAAGQRRVLAEHTFAHRAPALAASLRTALR